LILNASLEFKVKFSAINGKFTGNQKPQKKNCKIIPFMVPMLPHHSRPQWQNNSDEKKINTRVFQGKTCHLK
jgi:hypothetical protein